jgi:hypothetical protein
MRVSAAITCLVVVTDSGVIYFLELPQLRAAS